MALRMVLNEVLGSRSKVAILRVLTPLRAPLTGREIARRVGIAHYAGQRSLTALTQLGVLKAWPGGRDTLYELDRSRRLVTEALVPLFQYEAAGTARLEDRLKAIGEELAPRVVSVVLYGSVARGEDTAHSDVDVLFIIRHSKDKSRLHEAVVEEKTTLEHEFGVALSPLILSMAELKDRMRRGDRLPTTMAREGQTLFGRPMEDVLHGSTGHHETHRPARRRKVSARGPKSSPDSGGPK